MSQKGGRLRYRPTGAESERPVMGSLLGSSEASLFPWAAQGRRRSRVALALASSLRRAEASSRRVTIVQWLPTGQY